MRALPTVVLIILCFLSAGTADARLLEAKIEHSESMEPLSPNLQPGATFSNDNLPGAAQKNLGNWYKIPAWLGGVWHSERQTDYYNYSYQSNTTDNTPHVRVARADGRWGIQKDSHGTIWQYDPVPSTESIDAGDEIVMQIVRIAESLELGDERFGRRSINTQIRVDKTTGTIKASETGEEISYYIPQSEVMVKVETSSKVFDSMGRATLLSKSVTYESRLLPFEEQDNYRGKDMKALFLQFLKQSGSTGLPLRQAWKLCDAK
jgi:hypothetical protein